MQDDPDNSQDYFQCVVVRQKRINVKRGFTITKIDFNLPKDQDSSDSVKEDIYLSDSGVRYQSSLQINLSELSQRKIFKDGVFGQVDLFPKPVLHKTKIKSRVIKANSRAEEKRGPYRVYSNDQKSNAIELINQGLTYREVSRELEIPIKNLRRWVSTGGIRKKGGGRKQMDIEMERKLYRWVVDQMKETGKKVSRSQIRLQALVFSKFKGKFKASKGWTDKFVRKYNLKRAAMKERIIGSVKDETMSQDEQDNVVLTNQKSEQQRKPLISKDLLSRITTDVKQQQPKVIDFPAINFDNFFKL